MGLVNVRIRNHGTLGPATGGVFIREKKECPKLVPGQIIALNEDEARPLLEKLKDFLEETKEAPNVPSPPGTDDAPVVADRVDQILDAILQLNVNDKKQWTKAGIPQVSAIEGVLGYDITQKERDEAWEKHQERG